MNIGLSKPNGKISTIFMVIALFGVSAIMSINYNIDMVIHMVNAFFWGGVFHEKLDGPPISNHLTQGGVSTCL